MHTNRLATEKSPYLLQHAHNPVDWFPWADEAFTKARTEQKPIFLSVGYSTCHWCHVMERESFENEQLAAVLNEHFVAIKVDREERPDVDRIYMSFVQRYTGSGGWPMSVWLTPTLEPFYGGTYFPPDNRYGRPGLGTILEFLAKSWRDDRPRILDSSREVLRQLAADAAVTSDQAHLDARTVCDSAYQQFRRTFDPRRGGFGQAPKFPRPVVYNFLLRYGHAFQHEESTAMVLFTLQAMAKGGMNDQLGGGFHRYSVDDRWFVPHFEKMLYDQAQLAASYVEAYQITRDQQYADTARETLDYVLRDLTDPAGGFYSAEDADSVIDPAAPHEKGEGAFYIWTDAELSAVLGEPLASWFSYAFGAEPDGNVSEDPHAEFTGRNILFRAHTTAETAGHFGVDESAVVTAFQRARTLLLAARAKRVRPHLDDKVLASWNGLMISAFARAAQAFGEPRYREAAQRAARFLLRELYDPASGLLLRRYRAGEAAIGGFLDDYASVLQALLDLYETDFDPAHLSTAVALGDQLLTRFEDRENGGFFSTGERDPSLVLRLKEDYDGAEPAGNSVAACALWQLAALTGLPRFREAGSRTLTAFASRLESIPTALPQMLVALLARDRPVRQIVVVGPAEDAAAIDLVRIAHSRFQPGRVLLRLGTAAEQLALQQFHPELSEFTTLHGQPAAYVCENFACQLPTTDVATFAGLLQ